MKNISISYFYNVRKLMKYQIPVSTAIYDPKWFHNFKDDYHVFTDKRGIINGLRCISLAPSKDASVYCNGRKACSEDPSNCNFLKTYRSNLDNLNFDETYSYLEGICRDFSDLIGYPEDDIEIVLMVYEKYDNPCSERNSIIDWFECNGVTVKELFR